MKKVIRMYLGDSEVARVTDGVFEDLVNSKHPFAPNFKEWYDACFYHLPGEVTFEERFEFVKCGHYFCYLKPSLKLVAEEIE